MNKILSINIGCKIEYENPYGKEFTNQITALYPSHTFKTPEQAIQELLDLVNEISGKRFILCQDTELEELYALKLDAVSK